MTAKFYEELCAEARDEANWDQILCRKHGDFQWGSLQNVTPDHCIGSVTGTIDNLRNHHVRLDACDCTVWDRMQLCFVGRPFNGIKSRWFALFFRSGRKYFALRLHRHVSTILQDGTMGELVAINASLGFDGAARQGSS